MSQINTILKKGLETYGGTVNMFQPISSHQPNHPQQDNVPIPPSYGDFTLNGFEDPTNIGFQNWQSTSPSIRCPKCGSVLEQPEYVQDSGSTAMEANIVPCASCILDDVLDAQETFNNPSPRNTYVSLGADFTYSSLYRSQYQALVPHLSTRPSGLDDVQLSDITEPTICDIEPAALGRTQSHKSVVHPDLPHQVIPIRLDDMTQSSSEISETGKSQQVNVPIFPWYGDTTLNEFEDPINIGLPNWQSTSPSIRCPKCGSDMEQPENMQDSGSPVLQVNIVPCASCILDDLLDEQFPHPSTRPSGLDDVQLLDITEPTLCDIEPAALGRTQSHKSVVHPDPPHQVIPICLDDMTQSSSEISETSTSQHSTFDQPSACRQPNTKRLFQFARPSARPLYVLIPNSRGSGLYPGINECPWCAKLNIGAVWKSHLRDCTPLIGGCLSVSCGYINLALSKLAPCPICTNISTTMEEVWEHGKGHIGEFLIEDEVLSAVDRAICLFRTGANTIYKNANDMEKPEKCPWCGRRVGVHWRVHLATCSDIYNSVTTTNPQKLLNSVFTVKPGKSQESHPSHTELVCPSQQYRPVAIKRKTNAIPYINKCPWCGKRLKSEWKSHLQRCTPLDGGCSSVTCGYINLMCNKEARCFKCEHISTNVKDIWDHGKGHSGEVITEDEIRLAICEAILNFNRSHDLADERKSIPEWPHIQKRPKMILSVHKGRGRIPEKCPWCEKRPGYRWREHLGNCTPLDMGYFSVSCWYVREGRHRPGVTHGCPKCHYLWKNMEDAWQHGETHRGEFVDRKTINNKFRTLSRLNNYKNFGPNAHKEKM